MPNTTPPNTTHAKAAFKALVPTSNSDNNHPVSVLNDISQNRNGPMAMRAPALLLVTATLSCFDIGARAQQDCVQGAETTTTGKTMARQEDAFIHTRTSHETLLVG